jgi:hypothetical protein
MNQGHSTHRIIGNWNVVDGMHQRNLRPRKADRAGIKHMVYGKPNSFTNVAESLNQTRIQTPTVAWPVQPRAQVSKTQLSRMTALQTAYLSRRMQQQVKLATHGS